MTNTIFIKLKRGWTSLVIPIEIDAGKAVWKLKSKNLLLEFERARRKEKSEYPILFDFEKLSMTEIYEGKTEEEVTEILKEQFNKVMKGGKIEK